MSKFIKANGLMVSPRGEKEIITITINTDLIVSIDEDIVTMVTTPKARNGWEIKEIIIPSAELQNLLPERS